MPAGTRTIAGLVILGLAGWLAAPALSLAPYSPAPVEFHQRLPALRVIGNRAGPAHEGTAVRRISPAIRAPRRFDLVGIGGERRPVSYRFRSDGGSWSGWFEVDSGDPVWAGGADWVQLRSHGFRPRGDLDYINVSGTDTLAHRLLSSARSAVHGAFVSAASIAGVSTAAAAPSRPDFIPRSGWDPDHRCKPRTSPSYGRVKAAVVHHTVLGGNDYTRQEVRRIVLGVCLFHRNDNGWNDVGYNAFVSRFGQLLVGRAGGVGSAVTGAHTAGFNPETTGVASIGDHRNLRIGSEERHALVHYLAWKLAHHGAVPADGRTTLVSGGGSGNRYAAGEHARVKRVTMHRQLNATECPGGALADQIVLIRRRTQARIEASG